DAAVPVVLAALDVDEPLARVTAVQQLGLIGPAARSASARLQKLLDEYPEPPAVDAKNVQHATLRAAILEALLLIDPPAARKALPDAPTKEGFPKFKVQEIAADLKIGYAVLIADINSDSK